MNIDSILTERRFRLPHGYPKSADDFTILKDDILEMTNIDLTEAEHIVQRAMHGTIHEQVQSEVPVSIQSMYNGRVLRVQNNNNIIVYSEQPFDDHDFNIENAAAGNIQSIEIDTDQFKQTINTKSKYNYYRFDTNFKLQKSGQTAGSDVVRSVIISSKMFLDAQEFEQFVLNTYSVPGQQLIGLRGMYNVIQQLNETDKNAVLDIINKPANLTLRTGVTPIRGSFEILYDIIRDTIKIPNGDESELWFAIVYDGKVKGAVAGDSGIEADIEIGNQTVSLKNYNRTIFDFGSLDGESTEQLNSFIELAKLLTGQDISKSKGRDQINNILAMLDDPTVEREIQELIDMRTTTHIKMIQRIGDKLNDLLNSAEDIDSIIQSFCRNIDALLARKINSVDWWGMIIKPNKTLFLESSADLYQVLKCTKNYRLSPAIANFHQNHLFVMGSQMSTQITTKSQD
jgi:hypothetical protein